MVGSAATVSNIEIFEDVTDDAGVESSWSVADNAATSSCFDDSGDEEAVDVADEDDADAEGAGASMFLVMTFSLVSVGSIIAPTFLKSTR